MSLINRFAVLALVALFGTAPGDRPPGPTRGPSGSSAAARRGGADLRRFVLFGWVSPPASITTDARVAEMAGVGLNLAVTAWNDSGRTADNLARLDLAAAHGMRCLVWDERFERFDSLEVDSPEGGALLDSIVADYRGRPGFLGYSLGDEPPRERWPVLEQLFPALVERDPECLPWNNLLGRMGGFSDRDAWLRYTRAYLSAMRPRVLCNDHYEFRTVGDRGQFIENAAGLAALAREAGIPFWAIVLLTQHADYRAVTPGELSWQVAMLLAYGAHGIGYFTYWTPAPDTVWNWHPAVITYDGQRTAWYPVLADLNRRVRPVGETLASLTWLATSHAGWTPVGGAPFAPDGLIAAVEGRAALGHFVDAFGTRHVLVVNSDSLASQRVTLLVRHPHGLWRLGESVGDWKPVESQPSPEGLRVTLDLGPGGFTLLRFGGALWPLGAGSGPRLGVAPRPARGEARLSVSALDAGGRVEILDATGRRVRSWRPAGAEASLVWRGERDFGGFAPPGLYFLRAEDSGGISVARVEWLGRK